MQIVVVLLNIDFDSIAEKSMIIICIFIVIIVKKTKRNNKNMKYDEPKISIFEVAFE